MHETTLPLAPPDLSLPEKMKIYMSGFKVHRLKSFLLPILKMTALSYS